MIVTSTDEDQKTPKSNPRRQKNNRTTQLFKENIYKELNIIYIIKRRSNLFPV